MATAINKENFLLHKIHSLTGIVPVGYYMAQHLVLNTFSLGGPQYFNGVIGFFEGMPKHLLLAMEVCFIWLPLIFHAVYGVFITSRAQTNYFGSKYGWSQNRMYTFQRCSGIVIFAFLIYHSITTTIVKYISGNADVVRYAAMHEKLASYGGLILAIYMIGVFAASYHVGYGIWNFCIRWGITISDQAQARIQKVSFVAFIGLTLIGWTALLGFFWSPLASHSDSAHLAPVSTQQVRL